MMKGCVFNIQRYSVHDGPGIRTIVFLKGCPLRCKWCSNPESQSLALQVAYNSEKCIGGECLLCQRVCKERAIFYPGIGTVRWEKNKCTECGACAEICPAEGFSIWGEMREVNDVIDDVEKDMMFYARSNGGLTLSGGEPLMQAEFTKALLKEAKKRCIHTAIETTLFADWEITKSVLEFLDYVLVDIKCMDSKKHSAFTGVDNSLILANFKRLKETYPDKPVRVRTPVIPGFNDNEEDIAAIVQFVKQYDGVEYELLKYHRFGKNKYEFLGRKYSMGDVELSDEKFEALKKIAGC